VLPAAAGIEDTPERAIGEVLLHGIHVRYSGDR
jgi:hypothetical protein